MVRPENGKLILGIVLIAAWIAALTGGLGFLVPTLLLQVGFMWLTRMRNIRMIVAAALLISVLSYLVFVVFLDVPVDSILSLWTGG
ncbi:MAG: tripartite tricarboxylate transporter TctB family protein [Pseudomonadota bacterium]